MSEMNIQSRVITNFVNISRLIDTSKNAIQGFVIDLKCKSFEQILKQVRVNLFS